MTLELHALTVDARDPERLAAFWAGVLGRERGDDDRGGVSLLPDADPDAGHGFRLRFAASDEPRRGPNQVHLDLTSATDAHQEETVERALGLGASHLDVGQRPEERHVVLADPEGNEFCVIPAGNRFLAGCPLIGALSSDGSQAVGHFWSAALGWPLVWDQDEETAIRSTRGGSIISWGGPPVRAKTGKNRLHLDHVADDLDAEVGRLLGLGATRTDIGQGDVPWAVLADPDGNEFCVLPG